MSTATVDAAAAGTVKIGSHTVNRMGYGTMRLTGEGVWGPPKDKTEALQVLRRAVEIGVNFFDTADSYGPYVAEELLAEALHPYADGVVIATKGGLVRPGPNKWEPIGRAPYLRQEVEMSLRRLKLERIDLYQLHRIDPKTPAEESLGELKKLQQEGKIGSIGLSEVKPKEIDAARKIVEVASVQNRYNIGDREHEDTLEYCEKNSIVFIPWYPVASGKLTKEGGVLDRAAKQHSVSASQIALAWLLHRSPLIAPIPGTSRVEHLEENVASADVHLSADEWKKIEGEAR